LRAVVGQAVVQPRALGEGPRVPGDLGELRRELGQPLLVVGARRVGQLGDELERLADPVHEARPVLGELVRRPQVAQPVEVRAVRPGRALEQVADQPAPLGVRGRLLQLPLPVARDLVDLLLALAADRVGVGDEFLAPPSEPPPSPPQPVSAATPTAMTSSRRVMPRPYPANAVPMTQLGPRALGRITSDG
jgi:hypothetical protein